MVIPAQGVARHIGFLRLCQALRHLRIAGQVVHAQRYHAYRAGDQLLWVRALAAVSAQVFHLTLVAGVEPALQVVFVFAKVDPGDADMGKTEFLAPNLDRLGQLDEVRRTGGHGWARQYGLRCV
ncbi:conserved protein of unknown function [Pseudomonas inefficax]|uniref:Uncharacterized protein n=1 Tax=Pseudomonas inefficax TaxID=2078786 RepID=A0AAQ1SW81_9PSED|nr:conserved protein of unknown function [Pseudomonas inefficax]